jgi:hypothetical protein
LGFAVQSISVTGLISILNAGSVALIKYFLKAASSAAEISSRPPISTVMVVAPSNELHRSSPAHHIAMQ